MGRQTMSQEYFLWPNLVILLLKVNTEISFCAFAKKVNVITYTYYYSYYSSLCEYMYSKYLVNSVSR